MPGLHCKVFRFSVSFSLLFVASSFAADGTVAPPVVDFQRQVRPILSDNCFLCHGPDKGTRMANLRLDVHEGALAQRKNGSAIVPGKPDESLLIKRIFSEDAGFRMPPSFSHKTLTAAQKDTLRRWIEQGAPWKEHWAFIPPASPPVPAVTQGSWPKNSIDKFILAKLEVNSLQPSPEADRRTLIRRVTLDLTGLPPSPTDVEKFVNDPAPDAYEALVDRLLASPRYGEHRARYWLDAARYADTQGLHIDNYREMWAYRDWVIQAFNRNMPFNQFTVEQLAGDLLPNPTLDQQIASGFHRCNVTTNEGGAIPAEVEAMYAKDRADTTGTVWLGLTVGCATCHDHKFDPISQKEYYSLTSFFRNTTQNALDGNVPDTPPTVVVPQPQDREQWTNLSLERSSLQKLIQDRASSSDPAFDHWLAAESQTNANARHATPKVLDLKIGQSVEVATPQGTKPVALPQTVKLHDAAPEIGPALSFESQAALTLPNVSYIDTDKPFTVSTWVYVPKGRDRLFIAGQLDPIPKRSPGDEDNPKRGWSLEINGGQLDVSGRAPEIKLLGNDGKYLTARPASNFELKQDAWYHLSFSYDGTRNRKGLKLFVNGKFVPTYGNGLDNNLLASPIRAVSPLKIGGSKSADVEIAEFQILGRPIDEEDAQILYSSRTLSIARAKKLANLSDAELHTLRTDYILTADPTTKKRVERLRQIDGERTAIARRGAVTFVMQERSDSEPVAHVLYRGLYDAPKDEVHPTVPAVLPPMAQSLPRNRLGLAEWLVDPSNPLTARVTVNRFWQEVFGTGIVKTAEDFGSQGEPPSHPELLDWLAVDFRDSGWDVKRLFRLIVTSAAYRQSGVATEDRLKKDPDNRLLSRGPRYRMDGEMVRDYALAASGLLNPVIGGPSVKPYQPPNIWEAVAMDVSNTRFYQRDTGDKLYRRSLYTFWKRSAPPASLDIFNAPSRETCVVRRERTNTPLQALVTLNDPQFVEAARVLAQNALLTSRQGVDKQVGFMADRLLGRSLDEKEFAIVAHSYKDYLSYYDSKPDDAAKLLKVGESKADGRLPKPEFAAMTMVANELMNLDEVLVK